MSSEKLCQCPVPCSTFHCDHQRQSRQCGEGLVCSDQWWACELRHETVHTSLTWHHAVNSDTRPASSASGKLVWPSTDVLCELQWARIPSRAGNNSQQRVYYLSDVNKYLGHCWGRNEDDDMQDCQVIGVIIGSVYSVPRVCTALYDYDLHPVNTDSSWRWWFSSLKLDLSSSKKHIIQSVSSSQTGPV